MESECATEAGRLADQLERSYRGGAWHGPSIAEAIEGVDATAANLPGPGGGHSIQEIVRHVAYWLDAARRRIDGDGRAGEGEDDWAPSPPDPAAAWTSALAQLEAAHRGLHATLAPLDDSRLSDFVAGSDPTVRGMLLGVLQHNAYHAGQLFLLRRLAGAEPRSRS